MNSIGLIPCARTCSLVKFNEEGGWRRPLLGVGDGVGGIEGENWVSNDKSDATLVPAGVEVRGPKGGELVLGGEPYKIS